MTAKGIARASKMKPIILLARGKIWHALQATSPPQGTIGSPGNQADTRAGTKVNETTKSSVAKLNTEGNENFINYFNNFSSRPSA